MKVDIPYDHVEFLHKQMLAYMSENKYKTRIKTKRIFR